MWKQIIYTVMGLLLTQMAMADLPGDNKLSNLQKVLVEKAEGHKRLINEKGKCLDVAGDVKAAGTNVHTWDCNDASNQKWRFEGGRLQNEGGKCLDVVGDVKERGGNVQIWDCNDAPNQKWRLEGGRLVNGGGKCLDLVGNPEEKGKNVQAWDCNDAPNQKWRLE